MFFKKKEVKKTRIKIDPKDYIFNDKLYHFAQNTKISSQDEKKVSLLAEKLTRLIKANK